MGNCIKIKKFKKNLKEPLIYNHDHHDNSLYGNNEEEFNIVHTSLQDINKKINSLENKLLILENNTQRNLKLLSDDVHYINTNKSIAKQIEN